MDERLKIAKDFVASRMGEALHGNPTPGGKMTGNIGTEATTWTPEQHREIIQALTEYEVEQIKAEAFRKWLGESERDAAVRDTNHVLELKSR
jgi:hypothetical protein